MAFLAFALFACKNETNNAAVTDTVSSQDTTVAAKPGTMVVRNADTLFQQLDGNQFDWQLANKRNMAVIDIRKTEDYAKGHLPRAISWPYDTTAAFMLRFDRIDQRAPIAIYCTNGFYSKKVGLQLSGMGFTNIITLKNGIYDWMLAEKVFVLN